METNPMAKARIMKYDMMCIFVGLLETMGKVPFFSFIRLSEEKAEIRKIILVSH